MQEIGKPAVTTSSAPRSHGFRALRGLQNVSSSEGVTGRFGRMFRNLPVFEQHAEDMAVTQLSLIGNTRLWYYILKEAEVLCGSHHLGPVGARIVAETFIGLLWGNPLSFLRVEPTWKPDLADKDRMFGMPQLIAFTDGVGVAA